MSPFQSTILRWSALPLAGIALFFWVYDWLHHSPVDRTESLLRGLAWSTVAVTLVSFAQWTHQLLNHGFDDGVMQWLGAVRNPFPLGHSNYTAGAAVLGLPFVVHAAYRDQGAARSLWIMAAFLTVFILITSGSRGGLLGLVLLAGLGVDADNHARVRSESEGSVVHLQHATQELAAARQGWACEEDGGARTGFTPMAVPTSPMSCSVE